MPLRMNRALWPRSRACPTSSGVMTTSVPLRWCPLTCTCSTSPPGWHSRSELPLLRTSANVHEVPQGEAATFIVYASIATLPPGLAGTLARPRRGPYCRASGSPLPRPAGHARPRRGLPGAFEPAGRLHQGRNGLGASASLSRRHAERRGWSGKNARGPADLGIDLFAGWPNDVMLNWVICVRLRGDAA
jgi:hypothetical protein